MTDSSARYQPVQNGIIDNAQGVLYREQRPCGDLDTFVVTMWELRSVTALDSDFTYHIMPDACIDIVFDVLGHGLPFIMTPHLKMESIRLGKEFHYTGIRFYPGVFRQGINYSDVIGLQREYRTIGGVSLEHYADILRSNPGAQWDTLALLAQELQRERLLSADPINSRIVTLLSEGMMPGEASQVVGISERHLRRVVYEYTGFTPMQLRRILRFQAVLADQNAGLRFADQSHLIKEFGRITGMPYGRFVQLFSNKVR